MEPILLTHWRSPGDIVCMTACVRDLALTYPGRYEIHVSGSCASLWQDNPHVTKFWGATPPQNMPMYRLSYLDCLRQSHQRQLHFLTAFHHDLSEKLGVPVPVRFPRGDLHLSPQQRRQRPVEEPYWYLVAGGKTQITTKLWSTERFQTVVDCLRQQDVRVVQGGATHPGHLHPPLHGVRNMIGKTSLRDVLWLVYHAEGVICPVTYSMHVAAALEKPCVVIAGGREPWWWEAYVNAPERHFGEDCVPIKTPHKYLTGSDVCPRGMGCWTVHTAPSPANSKETLCDQIVHDDSGQTIPLCLASITPAMVVEAVFEYRRAFDAAATARQNADHVSH